MTPPYARVPTGRRGFTGHETLAENGGMIHMNGRLFDPDIGRFMTADPNIQAPGYSQSYNRYSYLFNNPLGGTDPTGFEQLTDEQYVTIVVAVVVTIATYGSTSAYLAGLGYSATVVEIGASAAAGAAGAFASTLVATEGNLEASFKSAAIGGITGAAFAGIGQAAPFASNPVGNVAARAVVGCAQSSAQGGNCGAGALSAGFSAIANGIGQGLNFNQFANGVFTTVVGGVSAKLGGGTFEEGAFSAALSYVVGAAGSAAHSDSSSSSSSETMVDIEPTSEYRVNSGDKIAGVIYLRIGPDGEMYVGSSGSTERFKTRQLVHDRATGRKNGYDILEDDPNASKKQLRIMEESRIRQYGGPSNQGGVLVLIFV